MSSPGATTKEPLDAERLPAPGEPVPATDAVAAVARLAHVSLRSASAVSVTLAGAGRPYTAGMSDAAAGALDCTQYASGRGPCLEAARGEGARNVVIAEQAWRWPEYAADAAGAGIGSSLSVPLVVEDRPVGALNVYSAAPAPFGEDEERLAGLLAAHAAMALTAATALADAQQMAAQLREALQTRDLIGQAKGILMERESCSAEEAFDMLRRASQRTNRKLREVASDLVESRTRRVRRHA